MCLCLASQALPRELAASVVTVCGFAANGTQLGDGTTLISVPPELPSPALTACPCSAVSMSMVHQHCAHDRLRAAVPAWAANRAHPLPSSIAVRLARSQRCVMLLHAATVL